MQSELLPCPFCGEKPKLVTRPYSEKGYVQCKNMKCCGQPVVQHLPNEAIKRWNHRVPAWLPIETAPKDGRLVLLWYCKHVEVGRYSINKTRITYAHGWTVDGERIYPTHWMPLPQAPEE